MTENDREWMPEEIWNGNNITISRPPNLKWWHEQELVKYIRADIAAKNVIDAQFETYNQMKDELTAARAEIEDLKRSRARQSKRMDRAIKGPFICGVGGKEVVANIHERLVVCPEYGADATYYYTLMKPLDSSNH